MGVRYIGRRAQPVLLAQPEHDEVDYLPGGNLPREDFCAVSWPYQVRLAEPGFPYGRQESGQDLLILGLPDLKSTIFLEAISLVRTSVPFLGLTRFALRNPASLTAARRVDRTSSYSASPAPSGEYRLDRKSTRLNSSHL